MLLSSYGYIFYLFAFIGFYVFGATYMNEANPTDSSLLLGEDYKQLFRMLLLNSLLCYDDGTFKSWFSSVLHRVRATP